MIVEIFSALTLFMWTFFCLVVYVWHYVIEVVLDLPISGQSPCTAHASLKQLIQRFIQEASELPKLRRAQEHPAVPENETNRTYEDLLSTAIINKVIQNYQDDLPSSSKNSTSSRHSNAAKAKESKEYFFSNQTLDSKWKHSDGMEDTSSISSSDECLRSESSTSINCAGDVCLTIQQCIEEVSTSEEEREKSSSKKTKHLDPDWQENWYLQKRRFNGSHSPVPVPMLVPNPINEAKVMIGNQTAEDTTDLSDAASDYGDMETTPTVEALLVESKTVIGGKNIIETIKTHNDIISDDESTDVSDLKEERDDVIEQFMSSNGDSLHEASNEKIIEENIADDSSLPSLDSNTEQNLEHTEKYASLPRTIEKSPVPAPRSIKEKIPDENRQKPPSPILNGKIELSHEDSEDENFAETFKGTYSEREKEKWKNAIKMDNNPYSKENIERRLSSRSNSSVGSTYGRDYYVKQASKSAGASEKAASKLADEGKSYDFPNTPPSTPSEHAGIENGLGPIRKIAPVDDLLIVRALPALVKIENGQFDSESSLEPPTPTRPNALELSSDSDLSIERSYNFETGKITRRVGNFQQEILERSKSPQGTKYKALPTEFDRNRKNDIVVDENHNTTNVKNKQEFLQNCLLDEEKTKMYEPKIPATDEKPACNGDEAPHSENQDFSLEYSDSCPTPNNSISEIEPEPKFEPQNLKPTKTHSELSKSTSDLTVERRPSKLKEYLSQDSIEIDKIEQLPSVQKLKMLFDEKPKDPQKPVYSLTARSIPNQVREELRSPDSTITITNIAAEETPTQNVDQIVLPSVKSRKSFFENLK